MPFVYNPTDEDVSIKVQGKWFSFKPKQMKQMDDDKALFISMERRETGLVSLTDAFEDPLFKDTDEGKQLISEAHEKGITGLIEFHRGVIRNLLVSLRRDAEMAGEKVDPAVYASDGELRSMRMVEKYQKQKSDFIQKKVDEVKKLTESIGDL